MESRWLAMYRWRPFYTRWSQVLQLWWINGHRTSFFSPCVLHRNALASQTLLENLKIVLKHVTKHVNFIRARARLFKVLYKDELVDLQC